MSIRVLLADDQIVTRVGLKALLQPERDIAIVGEAEDGKDALAKAVSLSPDVVVMDMMMPGLDGIEATRAIRQRCPKTQVLILTAYADQDLFRKSAQAGATGYILKDVSPTDLAEAIRTVHEGKTMISPIVARQMVNYLFATRNEPDTVGTPRRHGLTRREIEVLLGVAQGFSDKEIASKLFLSESTVKSHLRAVYHKLKLRNRAQAAAFAVEKDLLPSLTQ